MNRQGKSRLNGLLTQLGTPTTKKTGDEASRMQVDTLWVDELLEQRMQDIGDNISDIVLTKEMTRQERKEAFLKAIDKQQNV